MSGTTEVRPHEADVAVAKAADAAGIQQPSQIGETELASPGMLHLRIQSLEAIVSYILSKYFRHEDKDTILEQWQKDVDAGNKVLDPYVKGAPGPVVPKGSAGL